MKCSVSKKKQDRRREKRGEERRRGEERGGEERRREEEERCVLVEGAGSVFVVGVEEHLQGVVLDVGVSHYLLAHRLIVTQLLLHLCKHTHTQFI